MSDYTIQPTPPPDPPRVEIGPGFHLPLDWAMPGPQEIDLWLMTSASLEPFRGPLEACLSTDERARYARMVRPTDRACGELFRGAVRHILAGYLGVDPAVLRFDIAPRGKPALVLPHGTSGLSFNISHSGDALALACGRGAQIGVDIEERDRTVDVDKLAQRFFHPAEQAQLAALAAPLRVDLFFRWWTAKEALLKAWGCGLVDELDQLDVGPWTNHAYWGIRRSDGTHWFGWPFVGPDTLCGLVVTDQVVKAIRLQCPAGHFPRSA